jgi:hypothetical protein
VLNQKHDKHAFFRFAHILYAKGVGGSIESFGHVLPSQGKSLLSKKAFSSLVFF